MNIFNLPSKEREKQIDNILSNTTPEELLEELIECGLEVTMKDEEIKAIEYFKDDISYLEEELKRPNFEGRYITIRSAELEKLRVLLNLIEKQKAEIETLKRDFEIVDHECSRLEKEDVRKDKIIKEMAKSWKQDDIRSMEEIIEYFENKVKEIM